MRKLIWAGLLAGVLLWPGLAGAAIIGPTDDWKPLAPGARALGISSVMVSRILAAGVQLTCPGTVHGNGGMLNGWFLGGDATSFYTNAHGVIDVGADHRPNFIEPLDQCQVRSYGDLVARGLRAAAYQIDVPANRQALALATFTPQSSDAGDDRARLHLLHSVAGARALALPDFSQLRLAVGEEVIMVSMRPPAMTTPEIQACRIQSLNLSGGPGQLFTDCDNGFGNSAALYFVRDPVNPAMLLPIALHEGCYERLGDHRPWSRDSNTAVALILRGSFFAFRGRA